MQTPVYSRNLVLLLFRREKQQTLPCMLMFSCRELPCRTGTICEQFWVISCLCHLLVSISLLRINSVVTLVGNEVRFYELSTRFGSLLDGSASADIFHEFVFVRSGNAAKCCCWLWIRRACNQTMLGVFHINGHDRGSAGFSDQGSGTMQTNSHSTK